MFDMLQLIIKNYKKILFILFLFFVCVAGYYFYFSKKDLIFKNYLLSDVENKNNIEAPSWYKVEKIIYTDVKMGDKVKVYYDNEDMAVKIILLKKSFKNRQD